MQRDPLASYIENTSDGYGDSKIHMKELSILTEIRMLETISWGPYVKIGIVRDGKTPEQSVTELQTGNPRKVYTIKEYQFSPHG